MIPSPSLRCAACAAAGAGVHTTVYIKLPPAPAGRDAAKGIHKKGKKKCAHYCIHDESNCVHTTVYKKKGIKKEAKKRQARVYTNGMWVRLREQAEQGQARVYKNKKKLYTLGC